ncbi:MAG: hypothetical protein AB7P97_14975 [Hyphomonadaceae bacterium]
MQSTYDLEEHRHRFGVWAAARASQRGCAGLNSKACYSVLNPMRPKFVAWFSGRPPNAQAFDEQHTEWVRHVQGETAHVSFGRAAKLVNVYLKVAVVLGPDAYGWRSYIHPPIDARLMRVLAGHALLVPAERAWLRKAVWTKFQQEDYAHALTILRRIDNSWAIEKFWHPAAKAY